MWLIYEQKLINRLSPNNKLLKNYKKKSLVSLNAVQFETAIGLMLGDARLQTQNKGKIL